MPSDLAPEIRQLFAWLAAEPQERPKFERLLVEPDLDDATRGFIGELDIDRHLSGLAVPVARFELHVADDAAALQHEVVAAPIDLGPEHLDVPVAGSPLASQELGNEDVLDGLFSKGRLSCGVGGCAGDRNRLLPKVRGAPRLLGSPVAGCLANIGYLWRKIDDKLHGSSLALWARPMISAAILW